MSRRAARVDGNHAQVVQALRRAGIQVMSTAAMGSGFPDLLVALRGRLFLLEVKNSAMPPSHRQLTRQEAEFLAAWPCTYVVCSAEEAVAVVIEAARPQEAGHA